MIDYDAFKLIVYSLLIGVAVSALYTFYVKSVLGELVRKLIEIDATTEESALSLKELGLENKKLIKFSLRGSKHFKETVRSTPTDPPKYYLPEDMYEIAKAKYKDDGSTLWQVLLTVSLFVVMVVICALVLPSVVDVFS